MKKISEKEIEEIKEFLNNRRTLEAKKILDELEDCKEEELKKKVKRAEELEEFAKKVKKLARETGRGYSVPISNLEPLFVKYNIKL